MTLTLLLLLSLARAEDGPKPDQIAGCPDGTTLVRVSDSKFTCRSTRRVRFFLTPTSDGKDLSEGMDFQKKTAQCTEGFEAISGDKSNGLPENEGTCHKFKQGLPESFSLPGGTGGSQSFHKDRAKIAVKCPPHAKLAKVAETIEGKLLNGLICKAEREVVEFTKPR